VYYEYESDKAVKTEEVSDAFRKKKPQNTKKAISNRNGVIFYDAFAK